MRNFLIILVLVGFIPTAFAFDSFVAKDIKLEGLQRISVGTVFNYLPIKPGDKVDATQVRNAIKILFKTGFFKDIHIEREGSVLVVFVAERPAINEISTEGNDVISKDQLDGVLKNAGLVKGRVFNRSILEALEQELQRQYFSLGKYNTKIEIEKTQLERNRIDIIIKLSEGESAEIYSVNIIGNKSFSTEKLINQLSLSELGFFSTRKKYKKQELAADLEKLKSYYLDRGFLNFAINSTQVSLAPQKESLYISINIKEGERFTVRDVKLAGDLILPRKQLTKLIGVNKGSIFSRRETVDSIKRISDALADNGYSFANVNMIPDIDNESNTLGVTFFVEPGRRIYVNRINVNGNVKTQDKIVRRELRQLENDWLSTKNITRSKTRLERLGFFGNVYVNTDRIPGSVDQVNLNYTVEERSTGSLQAGVGYSDSQGVVANFAVTQDNVFGTGKRVGINFDNSSVTKQFTLNYSNPYYTDDGISRSFSLSYKEVDAEEADITNYSTDSYGASVNYGVPISEYAYYRWGFKFDETIISTAVTAGATSQNILDFIASNGNDNKIVQLFNSWSYDSRNKRIFATKGGLTSISAEVTVPGSDLEYYKADFRNLKYFSFGPTTLGTNLSLGYGAAFGDAKGYPPYKNYFVGGSYSVRGYDSNSIGPKDTISNDPTGGLIKMVGNIDLILPNPLADQSSSTRISIFLDAGGVFQDANDINEDDFRYTAGVAFIWITPVGAMRFNFSSPLNEQEGDSTRAFQFTLGAPF